MIWCSNSPDLSAAEPLWFWIKKDTTKHGAATSKVQIKKDWEECWKAIPQEKLQAWIERVPIHIKEVIRLEGGNEYNESKPKRKRNPDRIRP
jgi:hypothetical protein